MERPRRHVLHPAHPAAGAAPLSTLPAVPDGYTILFVSSTFAINSSPDARAPDDPCEDFAPVTVAGAVHPSGPARSVKELVDLIKARQVLRRANVIKQASIAGRSLGLQVVRHEHCWPESRS